MPFGSPQWPCANRWPKERGEQSMREARLPLRPPTAPKTERFEAGALPMASRNSFRHPCVCRRSGFRRDLCVIENRRSGVVEAASIVPLRSFKDMHRHRAFFHPPAFPLPRALPDRSKGFETDSSFRGRRHPLEGTCSPEHKVQIRYLCEMCIPGS
jgi:hypothetical protein